MVSASVKHLPSAGLARIFSAALDQARADIMTAYRVWPDHVLRSDQEACTMWLPTGSLSLVLDGYDDVAVAADEYYAPGDVHLDANYTLVYTPHAGGPAQDLVAITIQIDGDTATGRLVHTLVFFTIVYADAQAELNLEYDDLKPVLPAVPFSAPRSWYNFALSKLRAALKHVS